MRNHTLPFKQEYGISYLGYPENTFVHPHTSRTWFSRHMCLTLVPWPKDWPAKTYIDAKVPSDIYQTITKFPIFSFTPWNRLADDGLPSCTLHLSRPSFEMASTEVQEKTPISAYKAPLNEKHASPPSRLVSAFHEELPVEFESHPAY